MRLGDIGNADALPFGKPLDGVRVLALEQMQALPYATQLLTRLGAHESLMAWEERRMRREVRATANRLANFDDANLRRSARAAVAAGARVERALEILGEEIPGHLRQRAGPGGDD